ncbi:MAG TPA: hypothetical protein VGI19_13410 [Candidatus Cybelea sp.]|jgi:hypothetical protein
MVRSAVLVFASVVWTSTALAVAAVPAGVQTFAGNWSCQLRQGNVTYASTISAVPWGHWIKEDIAYPAQAGEPAAKGIAFLGYDMQGHRWIYNETDTIGVFFLKKSDDRDVKTSSWTGVYPTSGDVTNFHVLSPDRYTIDSRYKEGGKALAFHQICTRT